MYLYSFVGYKVLEGFFDIMLIKRVTHYISPLFPAHRGASGSWPIQPA